MAVEHGLLLAGTLYWICGVFWATWLLFRMANDPALREFMGDVPVLWFYVVSVLLWPFVMFAWMEEQNDDGPWRG